MSVTTQVVLDDSTLQVLDGKFINLFNLELCGRCHSVLFKGDCIHTKPQIPYFVFADLFKIYSTK